MASSVVTNGDDQYVIDDPDILETVSTYVDWKNLPRKHSMRMIEEGRLGRFVGLPNGVKAINKYLYGTHRGRYYLIGADSGVGKTTTADFMYIISAYEHCKQHGIPLFIYYYSFEVSRYMKILKWMSLYIYMKWGVHLPTAYIGGNIEGMLVKEEHITMIRIANAYVEKLMSSIVFIEDTVHPTLMFNQMIAHYESIGEVHRKNPKDSKSHITGFTPKPGYENQFTIKLVDHMALYREEQGFDTKKTMDLASKYDVTLRNLFDLTEINVQQFNTQLTSTNRQSWQKITESSIAPQRVDFGDSTYTYRDADVVLGGVKPAAFDMEKFHGYDITRFGEYFTAWFVMKQRYGPAGRYLPIFLDPVAGIPYDLPDNPHFTPELEPWYDRVDAIDKVISIYSPKVA